MTTKKGDIHLFLKREKGGCHLFLATLQVKELPLINSTEVARLGPALAGRRRGHDHDKDRTPELLQSGTLPGEDDLVELKLSVFPGKKTVTAKKR